MPRRIRELTRLRRNLLMAKPSAPEPLSESRLDILVNKYSLPTSKQRLPSLMLWFSLSIWTSSSQLLLFLLFWKLRWEKVTDIFLLRQRWAPYLKSSFASSAALDAPSHPSALEVNASYIQLDVDLLESVLNFRACLTVLRHECTKKAPGIIETFFYEAQFC